MNVLRDVLDTSLPEEFGYKFFSEQTPKRYENIAGIVDRGKIAWVLGNGKDYATIHQFTLTTRFASLSNTSRMPFRAIDKAREWLGLPLDYEIDFSGGGTITSAR